MAIVSSNHVVVRRLMGCARSSGIDEGLQDNVTAPLVQALLNACDIAYGTSCGEQPLHQELRARGQSVVRANLQLRRGTVHCRPGWRTAQCTNHAEPSLWAWRASSASGWSWQAALVRIKRVEEAALATPHRTWPWPLMAARPHPIRPRPARPKAPVHAPPGATFDVDCYRNSRQQAELQKQQVKNKTTKRPTPTSCRNSLSHRYDGTRPESTGLSAGTEQRRVQPVSQTTKRPTTTFCRTSR